MIQKNGLIKQIACVKSKWIEELLVATFSTLPSLIRNPSRLMCAPRANMSREVPVRQRLSLSLRRRYIFKINHGTGGDRAKQTLHVLGYRAFTISEGSDKHR